ncbi:glycoside hydrolase family 3 N-terminal domain-containing protein [Herbiconiux liukaitaii]|uniref:glycoside hydrolase family 3 N-terminal domain-containing protein n=1 Tax=Herbiconiux liukaitaii TaxID=3342799 RepID=UPI0035BAD1C8
MKTRARVIAAGLVVLVAAGLGGCVGGAPGNAGSVESTADSTAGGSASGATAEGGAGAGGGTVARARGEFPVVTRQQQVRLYAQVRLDTMTLEQKIASLFMVHIAGSDPAPVRAYLAAHDTAGVLLLGDNVPGSTAQTAAFTAALRSGTPGSGGTEGLGTLVAIDEEGGIVARLSADTFASAETLKSQPVEATTEAFRQRSALLDETGMSVNFGIVADVTSDPSSFIYERALGTDAGGASERVAAAVGAEEGVVFSTLKHFPGHGAASGDSHSSVPTTDLPLDAWRAEDAPPFAAGIDAGAELVMFGHLVYSSVDGAPASLSKPWHDILRDELGFDGVAVTDDLLMLEASGVPAYADRTANAIAAIGAGNDLLLYNTTVDVPALVTSVAWAVRTGALSEDTVDEAALRTLELRRELWLRQNPTPAPAE